MNSVSKTGAAPAGGSAALGNGQWYAEVPRSIRWHTLVGLALILLFFGGFGTWAATAPLASAVIAHGTFVATGNNKIVQHLEGGIIKQILVSEGDRVVAGQPLVRLDKTAALARQRQLFLRRLRLEIEVAALKAQASGADEIKLPKIVLDSTSDAEVRSMIDEQRKNFASSKQKLATDISLSKSDIVSLRHRIEGYRKLYDSLQQQIVLLRKEYDTKKAIYSKGLVRITEVLALQRAIIDAVGSSGRTQGEIDETESQIIRYGKQIEQTKDAYRENALDRLQQAGADLDTVREDGRQAQNVLDRATIDAPVSGIVVRLNYHTSGGVVESGKPILEILPSKVPLIIEVQVRRTDIDSVRVGEVAGVRLIALDRRTTPVLQGEVFYVSADALPTQGGGVPQDVYLARIRLSPEQLARVPGFSPTPGMPAEVLIQTAQRTFFSYLVKPVRDSMSRAFTER